MNSRISLAHPLTRSICSLLLPSIRGRRVTNRVPHRVITLGYSPWDHPYIMSAKGLGGWGRKMAIFADVQYCIYADIVGGWVKKNPKICRRNIGMDHYAHENTHRT